MSLRDRIKYTIHCVEDQDDSVCLNAAADAIIALIRAHLTSDEAVERSLRAKVAALEAEAARWREMAGELARVARSCLDDYGHASFTDRHRIAAAIRAALTRYKQESGQ